MLSSVEHVKDSKIILFLFTLVYNPGWSGAAQTPPHETAPYTIGSFSLLTGLRFQTPASSAKIKAITYYKNPQQRIPYHTV